MGVVAQALLMMQPTLILSLLAHFHLGVRGVRHQEILAEVFQESDSEPIYIGLCLNSLKHGWQVGMQMLLVQEEAAGQEG